MLNEYNYMDMSVQYLNLISEYELKIIIKRMNLLDLMNFIIACNNNHLIIY